MLERWRAHDLLLSPRGVWDGQTHHDSFDAWCVRHRHQRCRVWLAAALLVELPVPAGLPVDDDAALLGWARHVVQHYHGTLAAAWPLAVWHQGAVRGVSALHGTSLAALREAAGRGGVRLESASPWWALALQWVLAKGRMPRAAPARLLVVEGDRVVALDLVGRELQALSLRRLDAAEPAALDAWCEALPERPTLAIGYGLAPGRPGRARELAALDSAWPAAGLLRAPLAWR